MKSTIVALLALACVFGLATAQFGFAPTQSSGGFSPFLPLLLLLSLFQLFNSNKKGDTTILFGDFSAPIPPTANPSVQSSTGTPTPTNAPSTAGTPTVG